MFRRMKNAESHRLLRPQFTLFIKGKSTNHFTDHRVIMWGTPRSWQTASMPFVWYENDRYGLIYKSSLNDFISCVILMQNKSVIALRMPWCICAFFFQIAFPSRKLWYVTFTSAEVPFENILINGYPWLFIQIMEMLSNIYIDTDLLVCFTQLNKVKCCLNKKRNYGIGSQIVRLW